MSDLMLGIIIGTLVMGLALAIRFLMRPKETEISAYTTNPSPSFSIPSAPASYGDFSLTIDDIFSIKGRGTVVTGKVTSGRLLTGQRVHVSSADGSERYETTVKAIEAFNKVMDMAQTGDYIGILLENLSKEQIKKGMHISVLN